MLEEGNRGLGEEDGEELVLGGCQALDVEDDALDFFLLFIGLFGCSSFVLGLQILSAEWVVVDLWGRSGGQLIA